MHALLCRKWQSRIHKCKSLVLYLCMQKQRKLLSCRSFKMSNYRKGSDASSGFFSESPASQSLPPPLAHSNSKGIRKWCKLRLWCRHILLCM